MALLRRRRRRSRSTGRGSRMQRRSRSRRTRLVRSASRPRTRVTARTTARTGACEPLTVGKINSSTVTDIHNAAHQTVLSVPAGTTVHDQATVTGGLGTPTGTVTFKWFLNGTCDGAAAQTSAAIALNGSGIADATTFAFTPNAAGSFSFQATYSGDGTYNGSTGACEPLTVTKLASTTVTDIHNADHQVILSAPIGSTVHDKATVSGSLTTPTGTVDFTSTWATRPARARGRCRDRHARVGRRASVEHGGGAGGGPVVQGALQRHTKYNAADGACEPLTGTSWTRRR